MLPHQENLKKTMSEMGESIESVSERRALLLERIKERRRASAGQQQTIPRRETADDCPLSYGQELMWLLDRLSPEGSTAYNGIWTGRLTGPLNFDALLRSLNTLIERHQILRTVYAIVDGVPVQRVTDHRLCDLPMVDLNRVPEPQRELEAQRVLEEEVRQPFDLSRDLVMRVLLVRMAEQDHVLLLVMHHIAIDGWAKDIIYRELSELYSAFSNNRPPSLPELPIQYADFAVWQRAWLTGQLLDKQLAYWRQRLSGAPPLLELPTDYPRPSVQSFQGHHERILLSPALLRDLKALSQREGGTLFMTLMTAFQVLLYRYSGQEDMLVATVVANRPRPELEKLIGYFSNSLLLRTDLSGEPSFRDLMRQVRDVALEAFDHQELPFEKLVVELKPDRDLSYSPLFQVMFNLQNHEREQVKFSGLGISELKTERGTSKFDLTLNIVEKPEGLRVTFEYSTDLFQADTIRRMLSHFQTLLEGAVCNPAERISVLPLLTPEERHLIRVRWNQTAAHYPTDRCIHELFEAQVEQTPDRTAVVWEDESLTYAELNARANQVAHYLKRHGVGPEVLVVICFERSLDMVVGVLGVLKAGGAYVPLDAEFAKERLPVVLEDARPAVLLTKQSVWSPDLSGTDVQIIHLDTHWRNITLESTATPITPVCPKNLAYVIYTSGTTGRPKGVMVTHGNLVNACLAWQQAYQLRFVAQSHLQMANFSFDVFAGDWVRALCSGAKLVLCPFEVLLEPARLYELMFKEGIDFAEFVPSVLRSLLQHLQQTGKRLDFMRVLVSGSDVWHPEEHLAIESLCRPRTRVINGYGVAEATIDSCFYERKSGDELLPSGTVPIGRPFPNTRLYILDRNLQPVPAGVPGELFIAGTGVARGYLNNPDLTSQKFLPEAFSTEPDDRMYRTGDLARYLGDGNIEFLGRGDHQVKIRGFRVELGEIEVVLSDHPEVQAAVVVAHTLERGEKQIVAYVVPKQERAVTQQQLRKFLKEKLPAYMVPSGFVITGALPLTDNGKIDRKALPKPEPATFERADGFVAPRNPQEKVLAQIWAEVLKIDQVGVEDNFFELGGHSLLAVSLLERMRRLGMRVDVRTLFATPTVVGLAAAVNSQTATIEVPPNRIAAGCEAITPEMLPLTELSQEEIDGIVDGVPGGAGNVQDIYPLAPLQEGILFHHLMGREGDPYVLGSLMGFGSRARLDSYLEALRAVIERHDILRTAVAWKGLREPVQVVWRKAPLRVEEVELDAAAGEVADQLYALFDPRRYRMDVRQAPLVRVYVSYDSKHKRWLRMLLLHHLAGDHTTSEVMQEEIQAHLLEKAEHLPAPLPFRNLVAQARLGVSREEHEAFFRRMLGDVEEPTAPFGLLDVQGDGTGIEEARTVLNTRLAQRLRERARKLGVSAASLCHLAFARVVARVSGHEDVVFGTVLFGRMEGGAGADRAMGLFMNTLPVRIKVGSQGVEESVRGTHALLAELLRHEHASLALAQRCSGVRAPTPLFSALLNYRHSAAGAQPASEEKRRAWAGIEWLRSEERTNYPFVLSVDDLGEGFGLKAQVQGSIGPKQVCEYMHTALESLVKALETEPATAVRTLNVLPEGELYKVLNEWNQTETEYRRDKCVHELFEEQVNKTPEATAVVFDNVSLTYAELNQRANQLAHHLKNQGVGPEMLIGLYLERSVDMVVALLGTLKAGAAYVPLDPAYPKNRIAFIVEDAQIRLLLTQQHLVESLPTQAAAICLDVDWRAIAPESIENLSLGARPENLAYVLYTSGSTGNPKGVQIEHRNLVNFLSSMRWQPGLKQGDIVLAVTSLSFDIAGLELWLPLLTGAEVVIASREQTFDGRELVSALDHYGVTVMQATPATWWLLLSAGWAGNSKLKVLCGGETMPPDLAAQLLPRCAELWNMYGPTETTIWSSVYRVQTASEHNVPIGKPIANTRMYVLDANHEPMPIGIEGNLYIAGEGVARGYLIRPELNSARFLPDPFSGGRMYFTGDRARYLPDGNIVFLGRSDFQVKFHGYRIELGEIETMLSQHPAVEQVAVIVREDAPGDQRLIGYVTCRVGATATTAELCDHLRKTLPEYMVPTTIVRLEAFPLTPNRKIDRRALPKPELPAAKPESAPRDEIEAVLVNIWQKVLNLPHVGLQDNFFDLGGHSLLATRLVGEIEKATGRQVPLAALFRGPTLESLAQIIREDSESASDPLLMQIQPGSGGTPFFAVVAPGMESIGYAALARHMGPQQTFYKLQTPGPRLRGSPYTVPMLRSIASQYIRAMRLVQPTGPYYFGGMCDGTHIAEQMVLELEASGEQVGVFAVFDTWVLQNTQIRWLWRIDYYWQRLRRLHKLSTRDRSELLKQAFFRKLRKSVQPASKQTKTGWSQVYWPGKDYQAPRFHTPVKLFKRRKQPFFYIKDDTMGWGSRSAGGIEIHHIDFPHRMLREPYVQELATQLADCLLRASEEPFPRVQRPEMHYQTAGLSEV